MKITIIDKISKNNELVTRESSQVSRSRKLFSIAVLVPSLDYHVFQFHREIIDNDDDDE